ncbi:hypothetical protein FRC19_010966 [Serendipita sp. 401]|nr:hypothetical protein FRC19_010966 [Serendipita sp. 401]KAG9049954.1 hypothetical protein FS842_011449 [Serendipita sp. 407]
MHNPSFVTYDQQSFKVDDSVLLFSEVLKKQFEVAKEKGEDVQIEDASSKTYLKVEEYCRYHQGTAPIPAKVVSSIKGGSSFEFTKWDEDFMASIDQETLLELVIVAQVWQIQPLLDLGTKTVATMLKGKSPQQIREIFEIENDFTPEEEAAIKKEHEWTD